MRDGQRRSPDCSSGDPEPQKTEGDRVHPPVLHSRLQYDGILASGEHKVSLKEIGKGFVSNVAAMTSLAMMLLCLLRISIPDVVITAIRPIANVNTAISLLALGLLFEFPKNCRRPISRHWRCALLLW